MNKKALLEAALFVSDKPLTLKKLSKLSGIGSMKEIKQLLGQIQQELLEESRGIKLVETPQGYELRVKQEYREQVANFAPLADLGDGVLRTLGIIAVKQPIKQSVVVKYQGNKVYRYVRELESKGLINAEKFGRTKLLTTTENFERYFGRSSEEIKRKLKKSIS